MSAGGSGPDGAPQAIVLTFDNLGEASALERGTWDPGTAVGADPSVTEALPWLLAELDRRGLAATFFVEAINCELNPRALHEIAAGGHELGVHGWRHEDWGKLGSGAEAGLLARSTDAFGGIGLPRPEGFRPPGGGLTPGTLALLRGRGYAWCSPEGGVPRLQDGLAIVPFDWGLVDAYHLMGRFAPLRRRRGDRPEPLAPAAAAERFTATLANAAGAGAGAVQTVILHPFLMLDPAWRDHVRDLLGRLEELKRDGHAWVGPGGRFARWLTHEPQA